MKSTIWIGGLAGTLLLAGAASAQTNCSGQVALFTCTLSSGVTTCSPTSATIEFITLDLLSAAGGCDSSIAEDTPVLVAAAGGSGGNGSSQFASGGSAGWGGAARMATTIADLNSTYGSDAQYCYGIGEQASHNTDGGAGGASSILRTCANISQTATTGVLLIAGGGGGGGCGGCGLGGDGNDGGGGGIAISGTSGACPPVDSGLTCAPGSTPNGVGTNGNGDPFGCGANSGVGCGNGLDGVGGVGGSTNVGGGALIQGQPGVTGSSGQGGDGDDQAGGAGGGGYGGGGGGGLGNADAAGGGGGGSFAAQSTLPFTADPSGEAADGYITFVFNSTNIPDFTARGTFNCVDTPGQNLTVLTNGGYNLLWQTDGNLVLYNPANVPVFASNTESVATDQLCFQTDGNLVIYEGSGGLWASNTADAEQGGDGGQWLTLYQDGTLEIVNGSGVVLWGGNPPPSG